MQIYTQFHAQKHKVIVIILPILITCLKQLFIHAILSSNSIFCMKQSMYTNKEMEETFFKCMKVNNIWYSSFCKFSLIISQKCFSVNILHQNINVLTKTSWLDGQTQINIIFDIVICVTQEYFSQICLFCV